jgi:hypothetical protein
VGGLTFTKGKMKGVSWLQPLCLQKKKRKEANHNLKTNEFNASKSGISLGLFFNLSCLKIIAGSFVRNSISAYQEINFLCIIFAFSFLLWLTCKNC